MILSTILQQIAKKGIVQEITREGDVFVTESNDFWLSALYVISYILPIIYLGFILWVVFKFFKLFKEQNNTLSEIKEILQNKDSHKF